MKRHRLDTDNSNHKFSTNVRRYFGGIFVIRSTNHRHSSLSGSIKLLNILTCCWDVCVSQIVYTYSVHHKFQVLNLAVFCHCPSQHFPEKQTIVSMLSAKLILMLSKDISNGLDLFNEVIIASLWRQYISVNPVERLVTTYKLIVKLIEKPVENHSHMITGIINKYSGVILLLRNAFF